MHRFSEPLNAGLHPKSVIRLTWWGDSTIAIQSADRSIVIDPSAQLKPSEFDFVFCTHEHYAHSDPDTVERLTRSSHFKRMFIARSCLYPSNKPHARCLRFLNEPHWQIEKYVIFYPKHYDHTVPRGAEGDTAHLAGTGRGAWSEEIASGAWSPPNGTPRPFGGIDEIWTDGWHVEGMEMIGDDPDVPYPVRGAMPQPGFFIEDLNSGVSFCHLGANRKPYPEMEAIRGRLDILFLHVGKMSPGDEAEALRLMAPRCVVPVGWQPETESSGDDGEFGPIANPDSHVRNLKEVADDMGIIVRQLSPGVAYGV